jgi:hypothetical protein
VIAPRIRFALLLLRLRFWVARNRRRARRGLPPLLMEEDLAMDLLKNLFSSGALKSKTVWAGIAQLVAPLVLAYLNGGAVGPEQLWPMATGVWTILARAAATQPLSAK